MPPVDPPQPAVDPPQAAPNSPHPAPSHPVRLDDLTIERVLRTVECIPEGRVASYGDVGAIAGVGARLVGRIMRDWGSSVPWWRVTRANGDHPILARARPYWQRENIEVAAHGRGCVMTTYRVDLAQLRNAAAVAWQDLPDA
ncbi:MGMT family protein [Devriesea agamarum]|uniref:MGMT family protein n=1 Tax=Devriesea agamarum TaxID=472569 RepID=UPI002F90ECC2